MTDGPDLSELLGLDPAALAARLGTPDAERGVAGDRWLLFRLEAGRLRVRCEGEPPSAASWTLTFEAPRRSLRTACEPHGLWPAAAPDAVAGESVVPLLRRPLPAASGAIHTLTASVREDGIAALTLFDEPPDW